MLIDENQDVNYDPQQPSPEDEGADDGTGGDDAPDNNGIDNTGKGEEMVPRSRLNEEIQKRRSLEAQLQKNNSPEQRPSSKDRPSNEPKQGVDDERLIEFSAATKDLSSEEVEELYKEAKDLNVDPIRFIKSDAGKARLVSLREQKEADDTIPESGNSSNPPQKGEEELSKLSRQERRRAMIRQNKEDGKEFAQQLSRRR